MSTTGRPHRRELSVETRANLDVHDLTDELASLVPEGHDGLAVVTTPHTTVGLVVAPGDPAMLRDFVQLSKRWPAGLGPFEHYEEDNPNAEAHLQSAVFGTRVVLGVDDGELELGTYQRVLLLELDGPRTRTVRLRTA